MPFNDFEFYVSEHGPRPEEGDILVVPVMAPEESEPHPRIPDSTLHLLDAIQSGAAKDFLHELQRLGFKAGYKKSLVFHRWPIPSASIILAGCGKPRALNPSRLMQSVLSSLSHLPEKTGRVMVDASLWEGIPESAVIAISAAVSYHLYRSREYTKDRPALQSLHICSISVPGSSPDIVAASRAMNRAAERARDLVNMPPNTKRTQTLANEARGMERLGLEVSIVEKLSWIEQNMPCFFTVARGSLDFDPPRWIHLKVPNPHAKRRIALIGKSVIFDTGGVQVKPGNYMNTMKADMTGGATVLGLMDVLADLHLPHLEVHGFLAATPNLVSEASMLPDSIVDTTCGKKVEIRHTDAEGRLTLIDAVSMAERIDPDVMITVATLTGSAGRAVGPYTALMSLHPEERDKLADAGFRAADFCQSLDILEEDFEDIASKLDGADINNTGHESYRGAQTAAAFVLSGLEKNIPLLHLDIAGGDMSKDDKATGIAARAILQYLLDMNRGLEP